MAAPDRAAKSGGTLRFAPVERTVSGKGAQAVIDSLRRLGAEESMIEAAKNGKADRRRPSR